MSLATMKRRIREMNNEKHWDDLTKVIPRVELPEAPIVIETDNAIITSDWHWPEVDMEMVLYAIAVARRNGAKDLIIVGDLMNFKNIGTHPARTNDYEPVGKSINQAKLCLKILLTWFRRIYISSGNHDERIVLMLRGLIGLDDMFAVEDRIFVSNRRVMWMKTSRSLYALVHPERYSAVSMTISQDMATKLVPPEPYEDSKFGVMVAHTHVGTFGFTKDGLNEAVGLPAMIRPEVVEYKQLGGGSHVQWTQGFVLLRNSYFTMLFKKHTDWLSVVGAAAIKSISDWLTKNQITPTIKEPPSS